MADLGEILKTNRVVVTLGSGGVGKTTTAAALGVAAALDGQRVLTLTIDPARRLANSLGLDRMTEEEQQISAALFAEHDLELRGSLSAMMLDPKKTFDDLVRRYASTPTIRDQILNNKIYAYVSESLAGTQEYMAMEKLHAVREDGRFDLVILDTPPTSNALDFLDAPERMVAAIDSPAMRWFVQAFQGRGRFSFNLLGKSATFLLKQLGKFTGMGFLEQVAEFVVGLNDLFGGFKERAESVASALRSEDVAFVVVTSPAPLAMREAIFLTTHLEENGMRRDAVVVNAVHPLRDEPAVGRDVLEGVLREALPEEGDPAGLLERLQRALADDRARGKVDREAVTMLDQHIGTSVPLVEVPAFEEDIHDLGGLARVARHLVPAANADESTGNETQ